jgi:predicted MFS family arabinose efflux permease
MKTRIEERAFRTVALGVALFAALLLVLPDWAREGALLFAALYAAMVVAIDPTVRALVLRKAPAKSPSAPRGATSPGRTSAGD